MIKKILITVALSLTAILTPTYFVAADSYTVPMQILENGTNKTSYAAAYFAGSATVTPSDNGYAITSTITTDTSLGNYPVQMLSVDGAGVSIAKSQAGNNQTITYTFYTNDLAARHNANIRVDVDNINYHHNYTVGLVVDHPCQQHKRRQLLQNLSHKVVLLRQARLARHTNQAQPV